MSWNCFVLGFVAVSGSLLFSNEEDSVCMSSVKKESSCEKPAPECPKTCPKPEMPVCQKTCPPPDPCASKCPDECTNGFSIYGDLLYWGVKEEGLEFVLTGVQNSIGVPPSSAGRTFRPNFKWDCGYRIGASYRYLDIWDLWCTFTDFNTKANNSTFAPGIGNELDPSYWSVWTAPGGAYAGVNLAQANWKIHYWTVEVMTGMPFHPNPKFTLKPSFGFMSAGILQNYNLVYTAGDGLDTEHIKMKNNFHGNGLRASLEFGWDPLSWMGFHSRLGGALLAGHFHVAETQTSSLTFAPNPAPGVFGHLGGEFLNVHHNPSAIKSELDFSAGIHFQYCFYKRFIASLKADWDLAVWFDQNQMLRFIGPDTIGAPQAFRGHFFPQHGDVFLQGLDLSLGVEF